MLLIDIRSTNASAAEFIVYRLKLCLAGRHHHVPVALLIVFLGRFLQSDLDCFWPGD